jgi:putative ABC transport system permease protein
MFAQLRYTRSKDMGYQPENRLVVEISALGNGAEKLKQAARSHSAVTAATLSNWLPGLVGSSSSMKNPLGEGEIRTEFIGGDCDFLKTFQLRLVEGRDLDCSRILDTLNIYTSSNPDRGLLPRLSIILNETAVRRLGLSDPIGKELNYSGLQGTVVGVVKDIHNNSLHSLITPTVIKYADYMEWLVVAYQPGRDAEVVKALNVAWDKLHAKAEFSFFFLDDHMSRLYATDENFMNMTMWFSMLAIILSCLGLLGLTVFSTEQRTKEIGVRKILGASVLGVVGMLSKDFIKLVLVANVIAWPIAYLAMNRWLEDFAYRVEMSWWLFATAGGLALFISLLTVSFQAVQAALANPVEALRYE